MVLIFTLRQMPKQIQKDQRRSTGNASKRILSFDIPEDENELSLIFLSCSIRITSDLNARL